MGPEKLQDFLLWCLLLNVGIYLFSLVAVLSMRSSLGKFHAKLFQISEETANKAIYQYLAAYKLLIIVLNLVPWIAIQLIKS